MYAVRAAKLLGCVVVGLGMRVSVIYRKEKRTAGETSESE